MYDSSSENCIEREREMGVSGEHDTARVRESRKGGKGENHATLSTFPVSLMGCEAPMKLLMCAALTRGDTDSVDI